ncbi:MAG: ParB/RepB/Spo0J family partition protein [Deltaproteobacteria bacterium]|nr:ParB/RepB/Spo0J family partition protein [Deltaproteobacteria bacterium]
MATLQPATAYQTSQLYQVPLAELQADPMQPRKYMDPAALDELTASVAQMGIIQPVVCRQDKATGLCYVVAGERRCAAARKAGLATVPALFIDGANCDEIALVENILRQDLNPVEEAEALKRLMEDHAYQQDQLAGIIGKSPVNISETLSLNKLPKEIRDECRQDPTVPKRTLVLIARKKQERSMVTEFKKFREQQAKAAAKETASGAAAIPAPRKRTKAEAVVDGLAMLESKINALVFPDFTAEERASMIDAMTNLKDTLEAAIPLAVNNRRKPV